MVQRDPIFEARTNVKVRNIPAFVYFTSHRAASPEQTFHLMSYFIHFLLNLANHWFRLVDSCIRTV